MASEFLSRLQFAFVMSFHIIFPAFTIGLAAWLAFLEGVWLVKRTDLWRDLYFFWMRIFAVAFAMGVVSGIVMSFQFGTNWAGFSIVAGNVVGPLLNYEVLTAFFLEASFLGVMLFGWKRVSHRLHFFATCMVSLGTLLSSFWIMSANSWMQTPAGYALRHGVFYPVDWWRVIFNPSFPVRLPHMVLAAFICTAMVVGGTSAAYLLGRRFEDKSRMMLKLALAFLAIVMPLQIVVGDMAGQVVREYQPAKLAAIEARWDTTRAVPLALFAWPDERAEANRYAVEVPHLGSLILTHSWNGAVQGLKDFPPDQRPPVKIPFFSFRVMVGLGLLMLLLAWVGLWRWRRGTLASGRGYLKCWVALIPAGFVALLTGWWVAEVGRQPWVVQGLMRTSAAASDVPAGSVLASLLTFVVVYAGIFGAGLWYLLRLFREGPVPAPQRGTPATPVHGSAQRTPARPLSAPDRPLEEDR
ncbi:cytochrome ubiquinol oxidase subunit I [Fulvimonas sp. R45]|uniref:cytochrome ubiquinol oxidase subunit I n=1 Tax=Fulvimonas sp. R45 TaxID=3045937 RepID=UPI00265EC3E0|nr:cytochrome ubiquinol oxidase subunit I [Fulvimonas sp. R45]MDO1527232.1 cytochrome ubiquinol oxidase subunit I [Fulvimonas sp. R45]